MMSSQTTVQTNDYLPENQVIKARKTAASNASFEVIEQQMRDKVGRKIHALRLQAPSGNGRTTVANEVPIIFQQCQLPVCTSTAASRRNSYRSVLQKLPTHYRSSLNVASQPSMLTSSLGSVTSWNRPLLRCSSYNELATSCRNNAKTESNLQLLPVSPSSVDDKFATFSNRALPPADDYYDDPKSKTGDIVNDINASDIEIHAVESALCQVVTVDDKATESVSQVEVTQKTADEVTEDIMSLHDRPYVMQNTNNAESHDEVSTVQSSCILSSERLVAKYANDVKLFNINCRESNCANGDVIEENSGTAKNSCSVETKSENEFRIIDVTLQKGVLGLGFCIDGGVDTPTGSAPISVKRLFKGDTAAKGRLQAGDEILRVNDYSFENVTHFDAWNYLKKLPDGLVRVVVRRRLTTELDHDYR